MPICKCIIVLTLLHIATAIGFYETLKVIPTQVIPNSFYGTSQTSPSSSSICLDIIPPEQELQLKQRLIIYYAAMERNSQLLFNTTLSSMFDKFLPFLDIIFVPGQLAEEVNNELYCPNKVDNKCYVDTVHACAIALIEDKESLYKFLKCTMTCTDTLPNFIECSSTAQVDIQKIESCAKSDVGKRLMWNIIEHEVTECFSTPCFIIGNEQGDFSVNLIPEYKNLDNTVLETNFQAAICAKLRNDEYIPYSILPDDCKKNITMEIFYKVMDEPSQAAFKSLAPLFDKFSPFVNFYYYPCMFAQIKRNSLICDEEQDKDCRAGVIHSCAIEIFSQTNQGGLFKFLACTMTDAKQLPDFEKCANDNGLDFAVIKNCCDTEIGKYLCYENSKKRFTEEIPAIAFDLRYTTSQNEVTKQNMQLVLCQQFMSFNMTCPEECKVNTKLTLFYHTLDLEFRDWARYNLMKLYRMFSNFLLFELVPCRNAMTDQNDLKCDNTLDPKCYTDKFMSCASNQLQQNTALLVELITCLSQDMNGELPPYDNCAISVQLDPAVISQCASSNDGIKFCTDNFNKSPKSESSFAFQFGENYDGQLDANLHGDIIKVLCGQCLLVGIPFPVQCYDIPQ